MPTDHHLTCPFCSGDDVTPFPDPTAAWSCLDCARVFRVELVQPASVTGWGVLRVVAAGAHRRCRVTCPTPASDARRVGASGRG